MIASEPGFPDRNFAAGAPNRCWVADITYRRTSEGWLYLVAVQDLYSRRIDAWAMADQMRAELVTDALETRPPAESRRATSRKHAPSQSRTHSPSCSAAWDPWCLN